MIDDDTTFPATRGASRLLVTGGAGFIGSHFVRQCLHDRYPGLAGAEIVVLDALTYAGTLTNLATVLDHPRLRVVHGDVRDPATVRAAAAGVRAIVHFAAESHVDRSITGAGDVVSTNVLGTQTLLAAAVDAGVERFVQVSTDEVYGPILDGRASESAPLRPSSPYAASKASADLLALAYHHTHGLPVCVTRCSNTYGPHQFPEKIVPLFVTNLLDGRRVPLYGDGQHVRHWLHVDDHCRAVALVLAGGRPGAVYNVGGGTPLTNRELTDRLLAALGADPSLVEPVADRPGHDRRYAVDGSRLADELGFAPRVGLDDGLAATVAWYRARRDWWAPLRRALRPVAV